MHQWVLVHEHENSKSADLWVCQKCFFEKRSVRASRFYCVPGPNEIVKEWVGEELVEHTCDEFVARQVMEE